MKRIVLVLFISAIAIFIFSCKKSGSSPSYHITATVGGTNKTFNVSAFAIDTNYGGGAYEIELLGATSASASTGFFSLDIANVYPANKTLVAGNYSDTSSDFTLSADYYSDYPNGTDYSAGNGVASYAASIPATITNHFKVTITGISSTEIKGTFSGDFFPDGDPTQTPVTIINGSLDRKSVV